MPATYPTAPPGSIPAWAGETYRRSRCWSRWTVYPRVGGGNCRWHSPDAECKGLSPRGRGKPSGLRRSIRPVRSIPAWAGETGTASLCRWHPRVYPRVGGGNPGRLILALALPGLSPRGRGKLRLSLRQPGLLGSIPAWAGETQSGWSLRCVDQVYPRVGGGNGVGVGLFPPAAGLSPRGRGKPASDSSSRVWRRSIPAWAGETLSTLIRNPPCPVYPRVGGGNSSWPKSG